MIDKHQHKLISGIMDMLESFSVEDFEQANMHIDVKLKARGGYMTVVFNDEYGDWTYSIEQG